MPSTPIDIVKVVEDRRALMYTGTNSAEIDALIPDFTVTLATPTQMTFTSGGTSYTVPTGGWITYWQGAVQEAPFANDDDFYDVYRNAAVEDAHVHDLVLTTGPARSPDAA